MCARIKQLYNRPNKTCQTDMHIIKYFHTPNKDYIIILLFLGCARCLHNGNKDRKVHKFCIFFLHEIHLNFLIKDSNNKLQIQSKS